MIDLKSLQIESKDSVIKPKWELILRKYIPSIFHKENDSVFEYEIGAVLRTLDQQYFGYGVANIGIIRGYDQDDFKGDFYVMDMVKISNANWFKWHDEGKLEPLPGKELSFKRGIERHFKGNVEYPFRQFVRFNLQNKKHVEEIKSLYQKVVEKYHRDMVPELSIFTR